MYIGADNRRTDGGRTDKCLDQRVGKPVFILLCGPSALPHQEAVQIAARERPQDVARVLRIESRAKSAGTNEELDHAGLCVITGAFTLGLGPGERGRNGSRAAKQVEDGVFRLIDAPGNACGEAQALSWVAGLHRLAYQVLIALVETGGVQDFREHAGFGAENRVDSGDGDPGLFCDGGHSHARVTVFFEELARGCRNANAGIIRMALPDRRLIGAFFHPASLSLLTA